jgi:hypothetical protein
MGIPDENIYPNATGNAAKTVAEHQAMQDLVFYSGWVSFTVPFTRSVHTKNRASLLVLSLQPACLDLLGGEGYSIPIQRGEPIQKGEAFPRYAT